MGEAPRGETHSPLAGGREAGRAAAIVAQAADRGVVHNSGSAAEVGSRREAHTGVTVGAEVQMEEHTGSTAEEGAQTGLRTGRALTYTMTSCGQQTGHSSQAAAPCPPRLSPWIQST